MKKLIKRSFKKKTNGFVAFSGLHIRKQKHGELKNNWFLEFFTFPYDIKNQEIQKY